MEADGSAAVGADGWLIDADVFVEQDVRGVEFGLAVFGPEAAFGAEEGLLAGAGVDEGWVCAGLEFDAEEFFGFLVDECYVAGLGGGVAPAAELDGQEDGGEDDGGDGADDFDFLFAILGVALADTAVAPLDPTFFQSDSFQERAGHGGFQCGIGLVEASRFGGWCGRLGAGQGTM